MGSRRVLRAYRVDWGDGGVSILHHPTDEALIEELLERNLLEHPAGIVGIWQGERKIAPEDLEE